MSGGYDDGYSKCPCFWGTKPGSLLMHLEKLRPDMNGARALDAGCGEGKNAAYLSAKGCIVDAFDVSALAISNAKKAFPHLLNVSFSVGDVQKLNLQGKYDIIIAYGLLHCLPTPESIHAVIAKLKAHTKPSGHHVICAFNSRKQDLSAHPNFNPTLLSHNEYLSLYSEYSITLNTDEDLIETHPHNNITHTHSLTRIVAQNTSSRNHTP